jgi:hypothetical protein
MLERRTLTKFFRRVSTAIVVLAIASETCQACRAPPEEQLMSIDRQVALARDVSVATVTQATATADGHIEYEFLVLRRIAGSPRTSFTLSGSAGGARNVGSTFNHHQDDAFWQPGGGRLFNDTACVIQMKFVVGETYLAFVGQPLTRRSFERIDVSDANANLNDKWLLFVEARLSGPRQSR